MDAYVPLMNQYLPLSEGPPASSSRPFEEGSICYGDMERVPTWISRTNAGHQ